jgi:stearoyl-CoA desaturase (delta-9 desaturase)
VLPFEFVTMGELFQNNHHAYPMAPRFAARRFEIDPTWWMIRALSALRIVRLSPHIQTSHYVKARAHRREPKPTVIVPA